MRARLVWNDLHATEPPRFSLQRDHVRGEGVCYSLMTPLADPEDEATYQAMGAALPGAWWGPGALSAAKAACQRIADATDARLAR